VLAVWRAAESSPFAKPCSSLLMSAAAKKPKKRRGDNVKKEVKDKEPQVVNCSFAENEFTGVVRNDPLGSRFLEGPNAKYVWTTGIKYEGPFVASQIEGKGKFVWPDGSSYEGDLHEGKRHGQGTYVAADGVTRYEGQWMHGKRHGYGRLTYDVGGESFYDGVWQDGQKHGLGKQIWPTGNQYEGDWEVGKMAGKGTMTWRERDPMEVYCGMWKDNHPDGEGTHSWRAPDPKPEQTVKDGPSQQLNNRYEGQWVQGVRHGFGTFYYANGSIYKGEWQRNTKQGRGRHTFEDGRIYEGPFDCDQMTEYQMPDTLNTSALNIGAEDNPVRRCIDVSDLEPFALPPDAGDLDLTIGAGYDETVEVMREVHNMLLRHLGELKQVYFRYRTISKMPEEDPFVLSQLQLWMYARDMGILTPSCNLSRLNRFVCSGPRQHQEVAPEDMSELRPLTPRQAEAGRAHSLDALGDERGPGGSRFSAVQIDSKVPSKTGSRMGSQLEEAASDGGSSEASSPTASERPEAMDSRDGGAPSGGDKPGDTAVDADGNAVMRRSSQYTPGKEDEAEGVSQHDGEDSGHHRFSIKTGGALEFTKFRRREDADNIANIHGPSRLLMFRHFLEAIVRLSLARFPQEKGLEHSMRRLLKEKIVPNFGKPTASAHIFAFLVDENFRTAIQEYEASLWRLFKDNAAGEGAYDLSLASSNNPAASPVASDAAMIPLSSPEAADVILNAADDARKRSNSLPPAADEPGGRESHGASPQLFGEFGGLDACFPETEPEEDSAALAEAEAARVRAMRHDSQLGSERARRRDFGGYQRRLHVNARLDVTMRVKDLLQLLDAQGFLRTMTFDTLPADQHESLLGTALCPVDEEEPQEDFRDIRGIFGNSPQPPDSRQGDDKGDPTSDGARSDSSTVDNGGGQCILGGPAPFGGREGGLGIVAGLGALAGGGRNGAGFGLDALLTPSDSASTLPQANAMGIQFAPDIFAKSPETNKGQTTLAEDILEKDRALALENALEMVKRCDFTLTFLDVLRIVAETMSDCSTSKIHQLLSPDDNPKDEFVSLIEFLEMELVFVEFKRFWLRLVDTRTQTDPELHRSIPLHYRFKGFMKHIFTPSMTTPYAPPKTEEEEAVLAEEAPADETPKEEEPPADPKAKPDPKSKAKAKTPDVEVEEGEGEEAMEEVPEDLPPPIINFWRGFDEGRLEVESRDVPRVWAVGYEDSVAAW